jgi:hypothetical protein
VCGSLGSFDLLFNFFCIEAIIGSLEQRWDCVQHEIVFISLLCAQYQILHFAKFVSNYKVDHIWI